MTIPRLFSRSIGLLRARKYSVALVLFTGVGLLLRLPLIAQFPFREDEAIYAFWAIEAWRDPLFLSVWPDKPPLFIWLLSTTFSLLGPSEVAARLLNIFISVLTIPIVAATAQQLWGRRAGAVAALSFMLNPFAISFAPTAFTDPLLVLAGSIAIYMSIRQRYFWAGLWLGVAIMTKQQGILYVPLVIGFLIFDLRFTRARPTNQGVRNARPNVQSEHPQMRVAPVKVVLHFALGLLFIILPILYWDSLRWAVAPSPWDLSIRNYGTLTLLPPSEWYGRVVKWASLFWYLASNWAVWIWLGVASLGLLLKALHKVTQRSHRDSQRSPGGDSIKSLSFHPLIPSPPYLAILTLWATAFLALHITTTIQPWDRYLLPLTPILALLLGYTISRCGRLLPTRQFAAVGATLFLLLFSPGLKAATGQLPIGADHGAYTGLNEAIAWVQAEVVLDEEQSTPIALYHRVLGWHHQFYFAEQVRRGDVKLRWFPNSVHLLDNANKTPHLRKFLIQPAWAPNQDLQMRATMNKMTLDRRAQFGNFSVLELSQPPQPLCDWCLCRLQEPNRVINNSAIQQFTN